MLARSDIIERLYEIRFNALFSKATPAHIEEFRRDLLDFRSWHKAQGQNAVSSAAIRNWVAWPGSGDKRSIPKRIDALIFLQNYLHWIENPRGISHPSQQNNNAELLSYFSSVIGTPHPPLYDNEAEFSTSDNMFMEDPTVKAAVRAIVYTSSRSPHSEKSDLFRGSRRDASDRSYYLLFRYSTSSSNIVKTFIVINTPEQGSDTFSYRHIIWCRPPEAARSGIRSRANIFRECEGVIAKFPASYYFVGYNFTVPIDRLTNHEGYILSRQKNREMPQGLGLLAIEYETIRRSPGLFSGLTMTLAAADQPVIARVAMLHLGTKSAAQLDIRDSHVRPGELKASDLANDLMQIITKLKKLGNELSEDLEAMTKQPNWERTALKRLERDILEHIDMTPAAFKIKHPKSKAFGAIESIGYSASDRPRN